MCFGLYEGGNRYRIEFVEFGADRSRATAAARRCSRWSTAMRSMLEQARPALPDELVQFLPVLGTAMRPRRPAPAAGVRCCWRGCRQLPSSAIDVPRAAAPAAAGADARAALPGDARIALARRAGEIARHAAAPARRAGEARRVRRAARPGGSCADRMEASTRGSAKQARSCSATRRPWRRWPTRCAGSSPATCVRWKATFDSHRQAIDASGRVQLTPRCSRRRPAS